MFEGRLQTINTLVHLISSSHPHSAATSPTITAPSPILPTVFMIATPVLLDAGAEEDDAAPAVGVVVVPAVFVPVDEPVEELPDAVEAHVAVCGRSVTCCPAHKALANLRVAAKTCN